MINRYSSRREELDSSFICQRLKGAQSYDRIAGYFRSSMLEVAGEELTSISGKIRIVCNSDIQLKDVETAKTAQQAMQRSWCAGKPENLGENSKHRFNLLCDLLSSKKLEVKILPDEVFGLIHGKAGIITYPDGRKTCFMGSTNESISAWRLNYEMVWEDSSKEGIEWVQEEFNALWKHEKAFPLAEAVIKDIKRISNREEITIDSWKKETEPDPASSIIETPIYRNEYGLWAHQKYFVKTAFEAHLLNGARYILADQVGLGKTVQLALSALLIGIHGDKPILIIVPKTLIYQWQVEMLDLLDMPSAIWNGKQWIDEQGLKYPSKGPEDIKKCPRKVGVISQGLITAGSEITDYIKAMTYDCIIVDEAHKARRKNLSPDASLERAKPNNLMQFLLEISAQTKSLLLATATPMQLHPVEVWDLLSILSVNNHQVFGNDWSEWRKAEQAISVVMGESDIPSKLYEAWPWIRNPFPLSNEDIAFKSIRRNLNLRETDFVVAGEELDRLRPTEITMLNRISKDFGRQFNPFIRHIIRRERTFLEEAIDQHTGEPYLKKISVKLFGEGDNESIVLPLYLQDAYNHAQEFCRLLASRVKKSGFFKTLLLRRMGSSIFAGRNTIEKILTEWGGSGTLDNEETAFEEDEEIQISKNDSSMKELTKGEREELTFALKALDASQDKDPKYRHVVEYLVEKNWIDRGCIIFSQYFDSIWWLATQLSKNQFPEEPIGIYAGGSNSGIMEQSQFKRASREEIKQKVWQGDLKLLLGTDAASEGLNLQRLSSLINLDLPWNPTRLEQRKGRIQRIGQFRDEVFVYNMRYRDSVEDKVHELLSDRMESIFSLFGQIPDILEDAWIDVAFGQVEEAKKLIESIHPRHPFDEKYNQVVEIDWESCSRVLNTDERRKALMKEWS
jgi:superfamily II DNA or RNA helicase